jgi:hypothetical protein
MSITLSEGLILLSVAGVGGVVWWGVLRLVSTNDATLTVLCGIREHLALINGRLGKSELCMDLHQKSDEQQFQQIRESMRRVWEKLDGSRGQ